MNAPERKAPRREPGGASDQNRHSTDLGEILPDDADAGNGNSLGDPVPDTDEALAFLEQWRPGGPWVLTSIVPDGKTTTATFAADKADDLRAWVDERQAVENIYFSVNDATKSLTSKAKKIDIAFARALHVDLDPRVNEDIESERERAERLLRNFDPPPTVIIDSGGGFQGFWLLDELEPLNGDPAPVEGRNLAIEVALQADACHNIDRIMRLPGTINIPGEKKRKKGRVPALARVVEADWSRRYRLEDFQPAPKVATTVGGSAPKVDVTAIPAADVDLEALPISHGLRALIAQGGDPDDPARWADRSDAVWHVTCELIRAGVEDELILGILLDPDLGISAHVREQPRPEAYARRQVERARIEVAAEVARRGDDFDRDKNGKPYPSQRNIRLAIRQLGVRLHRNLFAGRDRIEGLEGFGPALDDDAIVRLRLEIDERFGFLPPKDFFTDVVTDHAKRDTFHPVCDYLDGLAWDGTPRLEGWLTTYGKAEDSAYTRAVGKLVLVAAVRRVRQPGVKFDEMLVLESPQGTNKSSALRVLAVRDDWFTDDLPLNVDSKRVIEAMSGKWIAEAGELKGLKKGGTDHLKSFLSRTHDKGRLSYDRLEREVPRQWIVAGTTNDARYLRDLTGNRRFWPVAVEGFDLEALRRDRDQLWAEAAHLEAQGVTIRLDPSLWDAAAAEQDARRVEDPFYETLLDALGEVEEINGTVVGEGKVRGEHVWEILKRPAGQRSQLDNERMGDAMRRLGFERKKMRFGDKVVWGYQRGDGTADLWVPPDPPF